MSRPPSPLGLRRRLRGLVRSLVPGDAAAATGPVAVTVLEGPARAPTVLAVEPGTTLLRAAVAAGLDLAHYCGGTCACGTCVVEVVTGAEGLSPLVGNEALVLGDVQRRRGDRLACQARVRGAVTVRIPDRY